jgi:nicotinate-nucleotide adenylyltransferase
MPDTEPIAGRRVALFGGSFDPPHAGHLAVARAARAALELDTVLFAPVGAQPLKPRGSTAPYDDRVAMTGLAIAGEPGFSVSLIDAPNLTGTPNYTIDTLHALRARMAPDASLFFLMGADSLRGLRRWFRASEIPFIAALVVASRPGEPGSSFDNLENLAALLPAGLKLRVEDPVTHNPASDSSALQTYTLANAGGATAPFYLLPGLHIDISASQIRGHLSSALTVTAQSPLFPPAVAQYIADHGLYSTQS